MAGIYFLSSTNKLINCLISHIKAFRWRGFGQRKKTEENLFPRCLRSPIGFWQEMKFGRSDEWI
jgi:hypothetical protein